MISGFLTCEPLSFGVSVFHTAFSPLPFKSVLTMASSSSDDDMPLLKRKKQVKTGKELLRPYIFCRRDLLNLTATFPA
jgi:hypothetical protein